MFEYTPPRPYASVVMVTNESTNQIQFLKEQLLIKERELFEKEQEIQEMKMRKTHKKLLKSQKIEVEKHICEFQKTLHKNDVNLMLQRNQIDDKVVIYKENITEITLLQKNLQAKSLEVISLLDKIKELEFGFKKQIEELENSNKARLIISEESRKSRELILIREKEELLQTIKSLQEKVLVLEVHISRIRTKKKNLKNLYYEGLEVLEETKKNHDRDMFSSRRNLNGLDEEIKGVLRKNEELEEEIRVMLREKEQILNDFAIERREKNIYKFRYEEILAKLKEMREMKEDSAQNVEKYYENVHEIIEKFMKKFGERVNVQEKERLVQPILTMPSVSTCMNMMPVCQPHYQCNCRGSLVMEAEKPSLKESNCNHQLEKTLNEIKAQYVKVQKNLKFQTLIDETKIEICLVLEPEFLKSRDFKEFILNISQLPQHKNKIDLRISNVIFTENEILMKEFKHAESFLEDQPSKPALKSLNDLSWLIKSTKFLVFFISENLKTHQIKSFLKSNINFLRKFKPILFSFGEKFSLKTEDINFEVEALPWEDLPRFPQILTEMINF